MHSMRNLVLLVTRKDTRPRVGAVVSLYFSCVSSARLSVEVPLDLLSPRYPLPTAAPGSSCGHRAACPAGAKKVVEMGLDPDSVVSEVPFFTLFIYGLMLTFF